MFTDEQEYYISSNYEYNDTINDSSCEDNDNSINYTDDDIFENLNKDDKFFRSLYNFVEYFGSLIYKPSKIGLCVLIIYLLLIIY